ncbi:hypothetical protein CDD80_4357 [Ophiocordyceps camponoti-rufipedis]|uniref:Chalcone synthase n=1 Tax=Ophiocordyceps camponoti-rufipedis TaxID=2004952 RepID=A0A2C5ZCI2_9HYPO|nr:hypothetical protein CDD80_4357 [Ophiocordyceps camponoti-rufipedis]
MFPPELRLSITGVGTQYPEYSFGPETVEQIARDHYQPSPSLDKIVSINKFTGIETRSSIASKTPHLLSQPTPPSISDLHQAFVQHGIPLAVSAATKAIREAGLDPSQITHIVSSTCTDSANPGFDHFVARELGLADDVEKVLLGGVGCSGGLAALRTGANLALGHAALGRPARVLCLALEITTLLVRSELDSVDQRQEVRIGVCLFSDAASAVVLSNGIGEQAEAVYQLLGWHHRIVPDTEDELGFDVDPLGWKVTLTPRVPEHTKAAIVPSFERLKASLPHLPPHISEARDFDWALHPGGASILSGTEEALGIPACHLRASYDVYVRHGNSSSATIFSVLDRLRSRDMDRMAPDGGRRQHVVACAFGPGITVEMCMLKRNLALGQDTPSPDTADEAI